MCDFEKGRFGIALGMFSVIGLEYGIDADGDPGGFDNEATDGGISPGRDAIDMLFFT